MSYLTKHLGALALALAGCTAQASEFQALLDVTRTTWPDKHHIGVVCKYRDQADRIEALRQIAGDGTVITVVDVRGERDLMAASNLLAARSADYLLLMPGGDFFREGSFWSTGLVRALATRGIPSVGTTPMAIAQGAVFAVGERTGYNVLVSDRPIGTIDVILPQRGQAIRGGGSGSGATLSIVSLPE